MAFLDTEGSPVRASFPFVLFFNIPCVQYYSVPFFPINNSGFHAAWMIICNDR